MVLMEDTCQEPNGDITFTEDKSSKGTVTLMTMFELELNGNADNDEDNNKGFMIRKTKVGPRHYDYADGESLWWYL